MVITVGNEPGCLSLSTLLSDDGTAFPKHVPTDPRNDVALLPFSSGTTGLPKGVMLTHYSEIANTLQSEWVGHSHYFTMLKFRNLSPLQLITLYTHQFLWPFPSIYLTNPYRKIVVHCLPHKFIYQCFNINNKYYYLNFYSKQFY